MTILVEIGCPECGRKHTVRKRGLGRYYCEACDREFTQSEVEALPDPSRIPEGDRNPDRERGTEPD